MADSVVDITIRATNEIGATLKQVRADIKSIRDAQLSLAKAGAGDNLGRPFDAMSQAAIAARNALKQVEADITNVKDANRALQQEAASDAVAGTFEGIAIAANDAADGVVGLGVGAQDVLDELGEGASNAANGITKLGDEVSTLTTKMPTLLRYLKLAAGGFLAFQSVQTAKSFADTAGRAQVLGTVLRTVAANAGIGSAAVKQMESEVSSLGITTDATRDSLTKLIQSGLITEATAFRAQELARSAQDLAVTSGQDSSETFRRLIVNIQQLDTVGLRYQGLIVDRVAAEAKFKASNQEITGELTKQQQQQALLNAVLEEAAKLTGIYELSMQNVSKQVGSLVRLHKTLSEEVGKTLLPTYQALVDVYSDFLKELIGGAEAFDENEELAVTLGAVIRDLAEVFKDAVLFLIGFKEELLVLAAIAGTGLALKAITALGVSVVTLGTEFLFTGAAAITMAGEMGVATTATTLLQTAVKGVGVALRAAFFIGWIILFIEVLTSLNDKFPIIGETARLVFAGIRLLVAPILDIIGQVIGRLAGAIAAAQVLAEGGSPGEAWDAYIAEVDRFTSNTTRALAEVEAAWDNVGTSQKGAQDALVAEGKALADELRKQQLVLIKAKQELAAARATAVGADSAELNAEVERREAEVAELATKVKNIAKDIKGVSVQLYTPGREILNAYQQDLTVASNAAVLELDKAQTKIEAAEEKLFGKKINPDTPGITKNFQTLNEALKTLVENNLTPFTRRVNDDAVTLETSLAKVVAGFEQLAAAAKSPEEIAAALQTIAPVADEASTKVRALRETLETRLEATTIKELEGVFQGLTTRINEVRAAYNLLFEVQSGLDQDQNKLTTTLLRLGATLDNAKRGVLGVTTEFSSLAGVTQALTDLSLDPLVQEFTKLTAVYAADTAALGNQTARRKQYLEEQATAAATTRAEQEAAITEQLVSGDKLLNALQANDRTYRTEHERIQAAILAVDKDNLAKRGALAKAHFDKLRSLRDESLTQYEQSVQKIKAADEQLASLAQEEEAFKNDIRRSKLTDYQRYQDDIKQIDRLASEAGLALLNQDYQKAEELNRKRIDLAKGLKNAQGVDSAVSERKAISEVSRAIAEQERVVRAKRREEEVSAAKQLKVYQDLTSALNKVSGVVKEIAGEQKTIVIAELDDESYRQAYAQLDELAKDRESTVTVDVDQASLTALSRQLKETLSAGQFAINVTASATKEFASGGMVYGPGTDTSDSITANLSNNEFVVQAKAVKHWGSDFMYAINNMQLPGFSLGGLVRSMTPSFTPVYQTAFAGGGLVTPPKENQQQRAMDLVEIKLNMGDKKSTLMGERRELQSFVDMINAVDGAR